MAAWGKLGCQRMTENGTPGELSYRQKRAIAALLTAGTKRAAAKLSKISERQLHRWLAEEPFRAELQRAQEESLAATVRALNDAAPLAVLALRNISTRAGAKDSDRARAANAILVHVLRITELAEIERRLSELEQNQNAKH
jgi:hypothetical protein